MKITNFIQTSLSYSMFVFFKFIASLDHSWSLLPNLIQLVFERNV